MTDPRVIVVRVLQMGQDGQSSAGEPQTKPFTAPVRVSEVLRAMNIDAGGRIIKLQGETASLDSVITQDNANIVLMPKKMTGGF